MNLFLSSAPHVHSPQTTRVLMRNVLIALAPCAGAAIWYFGYSALILMAIATATAVFAELIWQKLTGQKVRIDDLSAAVTGLLVGLNLPPQAPWWLAVIGSLFAIIIVKCLFGGLGDNFMNPALAARGVLLASWPVRMTSWVLPTGWNSYADAVTGATPLASPGSFTLKDLLLGNIPGTMGEVCKVAILVGLLFLLVTKTISWRIPVCVVATTFVFSWLFGNDPVVSILSGGLLFAAVFMATDYVTCPMTDKGQYIYAVGVGLLIAVIRNFGNYPEGATYAILLMNIATPLIDRFTKNRVYGHERKVKKENG